MSENRYGYVSLTGGTSGASDSYPEDTTPIIPLVTNDLTFSKGALNVLYQNVKNVIWNKIVELFLIKFKKERVGCFFGKVYDSNSFKVKDKTTFLEKQDNEQLKLYTWTNQPSEIRKLAFDVSK